MCLRTMSRRSKNQTARHDKKYWFQTSKGVCDGRSIRKSKFSPCAGMFPTYLSWIHMVNSDISEAIKRDHAYVIQTWFEPPHWQFWVYHPGGDKELIKEGDGKFGPSWISRYSESGPDAEYALLLANKAVMKSLQRKMKSLRAEAKASFSHWLWLILIASILWLSLAARASDKQPKPKPNPTPFPTPAMTFMPTPTETHAPTSTVFMI